LLSEESQTYFNREAAINQKQIQTEH